jgi:pimeloyl-ACP methyl ester carboxylesterase
MFADLNGTTIAYEVTGDGPPLVLLNGVMMTMQSWALQVPRLSPRFRCVRHDFRGQLRSGKPGRYTLRQHVDDLRALLDLLGIERADLAGTSYGGEIGMLFAIAHPERVRRLAVIACVAEADDALRAKVGRWIDVARQEPLQLYDATVHDNFSDAFLTPQFIELGRERLRAYPPEWFEAFAELCEAALTLRVDLPKIAAPTLVVCGENDTLKPVAHSRAIAAALPNAELAIVPGAGHAVVIEKPDDVCAAIEEFL